MVKHLDNGNKILMYPRFEQVFLNNQLEGMDNHARTYVIPSHTKKVFGNMKRVGKDFSSKITLLFSTMMVQAQEEISEEVVVEKEVAGKDVSVVEEVNATSITTSVTATTPTIFMYEITLAKAPIEIKTSRPKVKRIVIRVPSETPTLTPIVSSQQPLKVQDNGEEEEQERIVKEKSQQIEEVNLAWDDIQAKVDANYELAQRTAEKRNKPPTKAQQGSIMSTYLKNMGGWKPIDLKNKYFHEIKELFDNVIKRINNFIDFRSELVEVRTKKDEEIKAMINKHCLTIVTNSLPLKENVLGSFTLPCTTNNMRFDKALADFRAGVSVMPYLTFTNLGLSQVEARLKEFKTQEIKFCEKIRGLEFDLKNKIIKIKNLMNELEQIKKEKEGYSAVPPSPPDKVYYPLKKDMSSTRLHEIANDTITDYSRPSPSIESNTSDLQNSNSSVFEHGESSSSILSKPMIKFVKAADSPTVIKTNKVNTTRKSPVRYAEMYRNTSNSPKVRGNQRN
nr:hypothetical protein [Tanacetum cinerariifolium]